MATYEYLEAEYERMKEHKTPHNAKTCPVCHHITESLRLLGDLLGVQGRIDMYKDGSLLKEDL